MNKISSTTPTEKFCYSMEDITMLYFLDQWTVRMWIDRFDIRGCISASNGDIMMTPQAVGQIGTIRRLMKRGMTFREVRKYLGSAGGDHYCAQRENAWVGRPEDMLRCL